MNEERVFCYLLLILNQVRSFILASIENKNAGSDGDCGK